MRVGGVEEGRDLKPIGVGPRLFGHPPDEPVFEEHARVLGRRSHTEVGRRARGYDVDGARDLDPLVCPFVAPLHQVVRGAQVQVDQVPFVGQELDLTGKEPEVPHLDRAEDLEFPRSYYR